MARDPLNYSGSRPTRQRKNLQDRTATPAAVGIDTNTRPFIRGSNQRSQIPQFLNNLADFMSERGQAKQKKEDAELAVKAKTDVLNDTVDAQLYEDNEGYQENILLNRGDIHGVQMRKALAKDMDGALKEAIDNGEDFDVDAFIDSYHQANAESPEYGSLAYQHAYNQHLEHAKTEIRAAAEVAKTNKLDQKAEETFGGVTTLAAQGHGWDLKSLRERGDDAALTTNETSASISTGLMNAMGLAETPAELAAIKERAEEFLGDDAYLKSQYELALAERARIVEDRLQTKAAKVTTEELTQLNDAENELRDRIAGGEMIPESELQAFRTSLPEGKAEGAYMQIVAAQRAAAKAGLKDATAEMEQAQYETQGNALWNDLPRLTVEYNRLPTKERRRFNEEIIEPQLEAQSRTLLGGMVERQKAADSGDTERVEAIDDALRRETAAFKENLDKANEVGYEPRVLDVLNNPIPGSPQFAARAQLYATLTAEHNGRFTPGLSEKDAATYEGYLKLTNRLGYTPEDAADYLNSRKEVPDSVLRRDLQNDDGYDKGMDYALDEITDYTGKDELSVATRDIILTGALEHVRNGLGATEAIKLTTDRFIANNEMVGGFWVSNSLVPPGFDELVEEAQPDIEAALSNPQGDSDVPILAGNNYDSTEGMTLVPFGQTRVDGSFLLINKTTRQVIRHSDGGPVVMKPQVIIDMVAKKRNQKAAALVRERWQKKRDGYLNPKPTDRTQAPGLGADQY